MESKLKLKPEELKLTYDYKKITKYTEDKIEDSTDLVYGQERGIKAFEFGLEMDKKGYNIFFEGPTGVGKTMYVKKYLPIKANKRNTPNDICYVCNFDRLDEPTVLEFEAGKGKVFKKEIAQFVKYIKENLKESLKDKDVSEKKKESKNVLEQKKKEIVDKLNLETKPKGFEVVQGPTGVFMLPVYKGKTLSKEEYNKLDSKTKMQYEERSKGIQELIFEALKEIRKYEVESDKELENWESNAANGLLTVAIEEIKKRYSKHKEVLKYLDELKEDMLANISKLINFEEDKQLNVPNMQTVNYWKNYEVNLFVNNAKTQGAPVIMDLDYSFENIFGKVEYSSQYGALNTDYTKVKSGLLHKANGGYIVFQAMELLRNPYAYEMLKKVLKLEKIGVESNPEQRMPLVMTTLKPEPIKLDVKVILIGSSNIYNRLLMMDPDFAKLFKIKIEFEDYAPITPENVDKLSRFVNSYCNQEKLLDVNQEALGKIVEYASKISGYQNKLSTNFAEIGRLVSEASIWAKSNGANEITPEYIKMAFDERNERVKKYDLRMSELIENNTFMINTSGTKVGEINGLSVMGTVNTRFGKPTKLTANTYLGNGKIVNVENTTQMSGPIHTKGMGILQAYIGEKFTQENKLSMDASITFEQTYSKIDGDSASSTEIYVLLSSLSEVGINQGIAVTGSVNQKGEIQGIGGVNEKIKGFYEVCKQKGLTKEQGVIIPKQNVINLHLSDEIIESVKKGEFSIYAVSTIDEGIEILTNIPAGKKQKDGSYPKGTINYKVVEKLKKYTQIQKDIAKGDKDNK